MSLVKARDRLEQSELISIAAEGVFQVQISSTENSDYSVRRLSVILDSSFSNKKNETQIRKKRAAYRKETLPIVAR